MFLSTLAASLLGNLLTSKGAKFLGAVFLITPHSLTNFETQSYYQNEPRFDKIYSRNNLLRINECTHIINLDDYKSVGAHWVALYVNGDKNRQQKYHNKCL